MFRALLRFIAGDMNDSSYSNLNNLLVFIGSKNSSDNEDWGEKKKTYVGKERYYENQFLLILYYLRVGCTIENLNRLFGIPTTTIYRWIPSWLVLLDWRFTNSVNLVYTKEENDFITPEHVKKMWGDHYHILIDGSDIPVEKPSDLRIAQQLYSSYYGTTVFKAQVRNNILNI